MLLVLFQNLFLSEICLAQQRPGISQVDSLIDTAWDLRNTDKPNSIKILNKALERAKELNYLPGQGTGYNVLGLVHRNRNAYAEAMACFSKALEIRGRLKDSIGIANVLNNIGTLEKDRGRYAGALEALLQAVEIYHRQGDDAGIAYGYDNIANVLDDQKEFEKAIHYNRKSLELHLEHKDTFAAADSRVNLAERYLNLRHYDLATEYATAALRAYRQLADWEGEAIALSVLGEIGLGKGDLEKAERHYLESIALFRQFGNQSSGLMHAYWGLSSLRIRKGSPARALDLLAEAQSLSPVGMSLENDFQIASGKALAFRKLAVYDSAFYYNDRAAHLHDSIFNAAQSALFAEMQTRYETQQIENDKIKAELAAATFSAQRNLLFFVSLIVIGISLFGYLHFRQRQKNATTIARQQQQIHRQEVEELLKTQELSAIHAMLEGQETERIRIAKDLHDRLGSLLTTVKWSFDSYLENHEADADSESLHKAGEMLDGAYREVRRIAHNMVSGVLTKFGLVPALQELARTISATGKIQAKVITTGLDHRLESKMEITLYRIIQETLSNILKHAKATEAIIQLTRAGRELSISVEDNGTGFDPETVTQGMGLKNIEARVQSLNGSFFIDSGKGSGTTILIEIPFGE